MENHTHRVIEIQEFEDHEEEEFIPARMTSPRVSNSAFHAGEEDEDEQDYEGEYLISAGITSPRVSNFQSGEAEEDDDGEEGAEFISAAMTSPSISNSISLVEGDDDDDDSDEEEEEDDYENEEEEEEDYDEDEDEDEEEYEEGEEGESISAAMTSPTVSNSMSHAGTLQEAVVINEGLLDGSKDSESCCRKLGSQENGRNDGEREGELNRGEIDGLFCPICFEAWTSGGNHQICCLPCGHIYGLSCIREWFQRRRSSSKCPQCNRKYTSKDVRVLYAARLCVVDAELQKKVQSLEAKCASLEKLAYYGENERTWFRHWHQKILMRMDALDERIAAKLADMAHKMEAMEAEMTHKMAHQIEVLTSIDNMLRGLQPFGPTLPR